MFLVRFSQAGSLRFGLTSRYCEGILERRMKILAGGNFTQAVTRHQHRIAITDGRRTLTFAELKERANRAGSGIKSLGLQPGDRVGVLSHNRAEVVEAWLGLERFGFVRVVLHSHFDMALHVRTVEQVGVSVILFDTRFSAAIEPHRENLPTVKHYIGIGERCPSWATPYESVLGAGSPDDVFVDVDEDGPCLVQCTSGTTGQPKPWVVSHRSSRALITLNIEQLDTLALSSPAIGPSDTNFHFHALQWASGALTLLAFMLRGAKSVLFDDETFDPVRVVEGLSNERATATFIPAPMLPPMLDVIEGRKDLKIHMRKATIFFATPELLERANRVLGPVWSHGYGSSEQGGPTARLTAEDVIGHPRRLESVGRPSTVSNELAVVNESGKRLPPNTVGEIVARSAISTNRYWNLPDETANAFFWEIGSGRRISVISMRTASSTISIARKIELLPPAALSIRMSSKRHCCPITRSPTAALWGLPLPGRTKSLRRYC
jgi:acyl-CoA synthetase (AMP-forming)/AMP-acid ligase II